MKKFLLLLSAFFILGNATVFSFSDVPESHSNFSAIKYLSDKGVLNGYKDGTFKPEQSVNRAEALKIIFTAFKLSTESSDDTKFSDVKSADWFYNYVVAATDQGIVKGYDDGSFKPGRTVSLGELLKILVEARENNFQVGVDYDVFADVKKDSWQAKYAYYAREKQLLLADNYGRIGIDGQVTRGMIAEIVYRRLFMDDLGKNTFPLSTNWKFYAAKKLPFRMKVDPTWKIIETENTLVFFKADLIYGQFDYFRVYPNTGKISFSVDPNESRFNRGDYFGKVKALFPGAEYKEFEINGYKALEVLYPEKRMVDWYIYLTDNRVMAIYTEYGNGILSLQLPRQIKAMIGSWEYSTAGNTTTTNTQLSDDQVLSKIFANVLVEGKGLEMLKLLDDKIIIETDSIGVGTGAVDYYYSSKMAYTFKYERSADVILAVQSGKTSSF